MSANAISSQLQKLFCLFFSLWGGCTWLVLERLGRVDPESLCGNNVAQLNIGEECDGQDLAGQNCLSLDPRFISGQLSCTDECSFDLSGCIEPAPCGDGLIEPGEQCDDGNFISGDGCSQECQVEPGFDCEGEPSACDSICGDGLTVGAEECDDADQDNNDGCLSTCVAQDGFACAGSPIVCFLPKCGDGVLDLGEACDDGNFLSGDGCDLRCRLEPGFVCLGVPSLCLLPSCGDGVLDIGEECDDGCGGDGVCDISDNNDGCEANCRFICGGAPDADQAVLFQSKCYTGFDDLLSHAEAEADCQTHGAHLVTLSSTEEDALVGSMVSRFEGAVDLSWLGMIEGNTPGNVGGFVWRTGEPLAAFALFSANQPIDSPEPDCGIRTQNFGWATIPCALENRFVCEAEPQCGDGIVGNSPNEVCDDGNNAAGDGCRPDCKGFERCGDGLLDEDPLVLNPEACDDGNTTAGDGCNRVCQSE